MRRSTIGPALVGVALFSITVGCQRPTRVTPAPPAVPGLPWSEPDSNEATWALLDKLHIRRDAVRAASHRLLDPNQLKAQLRRIGDTGRGELSLPSLEGQALFDVEVVKDCSGERILAYRGTRRDVAEERVNIVDIGSDIRIFRVGAREVVALTFDAGSGQYITIASRAGQEPVERFVTGPLESPSCQTTEREGFAISAVDLQQTGYDVLRQYELAVIPTWQFVKKFARKDPARAWREIVNIVTNATVTLERDAGLRLCLVDTETLIPASPKEEVEGDTLDERWNDLRAKLGERQYDIAHLFDYGDKKGSGKATIGVACVPHQKVRGYTRFPLLGVPFQAGLFLHEASHQLGAHHSFDGPPPSGYGNERHEPTSVEPGSGSTLMSYAGHLEPRYNLVENREFYLHPTSVSELRVIADHSGTCAADLLTGQRPFPSTTSAWSIPPETPFRLELTPPSGSIVHWDEVDPGGTDPINTPPFVRSYVNAGAGRTFPKKPFFPGETTVLGDLLPRGGEQLRFRAVARKGVAAGSVDVSVAVLKYGAFIVTAPAKLTVWDQPTATVAWNVGSAAAAGASIVQLSISINGGAWQDLWPSETPLENTPGSGKGSVDVDVPKGVSGTAQVRIAAKGQIFFADSQPFKIDSTTTASREE